MGEIQSHSQKIPLSRFLRLAFIFIFLTAAIAEFFLGREDWPFSRFGMYAEYVSQKENCRYQIRVYLDDKENPAKAANYHFDWLIGILSDQTDCGYFLQGHREEFQRRFGEILEKEGQKILSDFEGQDIKRIILAASLAHWKSWSAANVKNPDQLVLLYEKEFNAD